MKVYKTTDMSHHWFTFEDAQKCLRKGCITHTYKAIALTQGNVVFAFRLCQSCYQRYTLLIMVGDNEWTARFYEKERT
jgi:hypothetical protein